MPTFKGHCHCKQIEWSVEMEQTAHVLCHCNACKTLSGGAYTLNQVVPATALKFTRGEDKLKKYTYRADSGNDVHCYYCSECTTHPYHHQTIRGANYVLRTVLLDPEGKTWEPVAEVYGKDRLKWVPEVAKTFEVNPPE